jgi:hypothetical protein
MQNTVESGYGAEILFREWIPQAFVDHHQMGAYTARMYVPPYAEPIRPEGRSARVARDGLVRGAHGVRMDEAELAGAIGAAIYSGWGHFGFHWITPFHNIAGMLTESASARWRRRSTCIPTSSRARGSFPSTRRRPRSRTPGRAAGGRCATS